VHYASHAFYFAIRQYLIFCVAGSPHGKKGKVDGVVMVNFSPYFIANPGEADVKLVADHVEHIARVAGKKQYVQPFSVCSRRVVGLTLRGPVSGLAPIMME